MAFGIQRYGKITGQTRKTNSLPPTPKSPSPLLSMHDYHGLRGGERKISVHAALVGSGEWITVMGPNGAGKSSLLLAIMHLIKTEGTCVIDGLTTKKIEQLAERVAFVFQNPEFQFVTNSVAEEVAFSLQWEPLTDEQRTERVHQLLSQYGLQDYHARHPYQLSMGQKRRLSVLVAIARGQQLLLLDEPTFGLDARSTFAMLEHLEQLRQQGTSIIMITHDPQIAQRYATRRWNVEQGVLTETKKEEKMILCN